MRRSTRTRRRSGIAGIVAGLILFVILFTVGTGYFLWVNTNNLSYTQALAAKDAANIAQKSESIGLNASISGCPTACTDYSVTVTNTGGIPVNVISVVISDANGNILGGGPDDLPNGGTAVNPGGGVAQVLTTIPYSSQTVSIKAVTQRGTVFSLTYIPPTVTTTLTHSSTPAGTADTDTATLTGGTNPTGTVKFYVTTGTVCQVADGTQVGQPVAVAGDGNYQSSSMTMAQQGSYNWFAVYSGDADNPDAISLCEPLAVTQAAPTITTTLEPLNSISVGDSAYDTATLAGATAGAGGTVTYNTFLDGICGSGLTQDGAPVPVTAGAVHQSQPVTYNTPGTYSWDAVYSGDSNNGGAVSPCEPIGVTKTTAAISTSLSSTTIVAGASDYDTATLTGVTSTAGGTVSYVYFSSSSCTGAATTVGSPVAVTDGQVEQSGNQVFNTPPFQYGWEAVYSGDANNAGATSACEPLLVQSNPTLSTSLSAASISLGGSVADTATLAGGSTNPVATGSLKFFYSTQDTCPTTGAIQVGTTITVNGNGQYSSPTSQPFTQGGTYYWYADYSGDANNAGAVSPCEPLTVGLSITTTLSAATIETGGSVYDSSQLNYATQTASGTVTYSWFYGSSCTGTAAVVSTVTVTNAQIPPSTSVSFTTTGSYSWDAVYSGDVSLGGTNAGPVTSPCEPLIVLPTSSSGAGSLGLVSESFKFYYTNCNPIGGSQPQSSCSSSIDGLGDGVSVGGYYGYGISFDGAQSCGSIFSNSCPQKNGQYLPVGDIFQVSLTNTDPSRSITLSSQSFLLLQAECQGNFFSSCSSSFASCFLICTPPFSSGYWIIDGVSSSGGNGAVPLPYSSPVVIAPGATATLYFFCQGTPCTSSSSLQSALEQDAFPPSGQSLVVSLGLYGIYSDGTPFGEDIPYVASYVSPVTITTVSPSSSLIAGVNYLTGAVGSTITLTASNFPYDPSALTVYWINQDGTTTAVTNPTGPNCSGGSATCTVGFTIPNNAVAGNYYGVYVTADGVNNAYMTVEVTGTTSTTVLCTPASAIIGGSSTCTATVAGRTPTGTVTWSQTGTGSVTFTPGSMTCTLSGGSCTVTVTGHTVGSVSITATYGGDSGNQGSSGSFGYTVNKATTSTAVACSGSSCTATVAGFSGTITGETITWSQSGAGTVSFSANTCALSSGGACTVTVRGLTPGGVTVQASYPGDASNLASSGTAALTISSPALTASCTPASVGISGTTTCTATLTGFSGAVTGGTISWTQSAGSGGVTFPSPATCTLSAAGTCSITVTGHTVGSATVQASYAGDIANGPATGTFVLAVKASTATAVTCTPTSISVGATSSCTATVTGASGSIAGETITFSKTTGTGAVTFPSPATCTLVGTSCSLTVTGATAGSATIQASYPGDTNNAGSTGTAAITIKATSSTAVSCLLTTFQDGASTTCTATVTGFAAPVSGETITWSQSSGTGGVSFSPSTTCSLSSAGTCSVTVTGTAPGSATVQASYPGDTNNNPSSGTLATTISKVTTTTSVSCSGATCTATVTGQSPTGTITWSKVSGTGAVTFGSGAQCTLAAGACSVSISGTTSGSLVIQGVYGGDTNNAGSTGTTSLTVHADTISVSCTPTSFNLGSTSSCTASLGAYTSPVTGEAITFSQSGAGTVTFTSNTCTLSAAGTCSVTVTGATSGAVTVQASYPGDSANVASVGTQGITVTGKHPAVLVQTLVLCSGSIGNSCSGSLPQPVTSGDVMVVAVSTLRTSSTTCRTVSSVAGTRGEATYNLVSGGSATASYGGFADECAYSAIYYDTVVTSGTDTITVTLSGSPNSGAVVVYEVSSALTPPTAVLGTCNSGSCTNSLSAASMSVAANSFLVTAGAICQSNIGTSRTITSGPFGTGDYGPGQAELIDNELPTTVGTQTFPMTGSGTSACWTDVGAQFVDPPASAPVLGGPYGSSSAAVSGSSGTPFLALALFSLASPMIERSADLRKNDHASGGQKSR